MTKPVHVVVKVVARSDAVADVRSIVLTLAEKSRAETGCTSYEVIQNLAEPETFLLVEEWESIAALEAQPLPAKAALRSVTKTADGGDGALVSADDAVRHLASLPAHERALALTKLSLANPGPPRF